MTFNVDIDLKITSSKLLAGIVILVGLVYGLKDFTSMIILVETGAAIFFHKNHVQHKEKLNGGNHETISKRGMGKNKAAHNK